LYIQLNLSWSLSQCWSQTRDVLGLNPTDANEEPTCPTVGQYLGRYFPKFVDGVNQSMEKNASPFPLPSFKITLLFKTPPLVESNKDKQASWGCRDRYQCDYNAVHAL
jgi:hypothetical protein